jgi:hypothetical protein
VDLNRLGLRLLLVAEGDAHQREGQAVHGLRLALERPSGQPEGEDGPVELVGVHRVPAELQVARPTDQLVAADRVQPEQLARLDRGEGREGGVVEALEGGDPLTRHPGLGLAEVEDHALGGDRRLERAHQLRALPALVPEHACLLRLPVEPRRPPVATLYGAREAL